MGNKNRWVALQVLAFSLLMLSNFAYSEPLGENQTKLDTARQKRSGFTFLPILFYTPETKLAGGASVIYFFRSPGDSVVTRPSTISPVLIYTQKEQIISQLFADLYWKDEIYHLTANVGYLKFPDRFFGIGNNTSKDDEENYTPRSITISVSFQKRVVPGLNLGIQYEFEHYKIIEVEENGLLARGDIPGSEGGRTSGAGVFVNWDTRDNIFYPLSGSFHQLSAGLFRHALGSDYDFARYKLDLRKYLPLFSSHVLAFQGYINIITGDPPFQMLSLLGGQNLMRGYYQGRYRDRKMVVLQVEYRMPLWWRFGLVGFIGFGDVVEKVKSLELRNFKYSVGWGIRYLYNREEGINIRLDFGFGKESSGVYITVSEAF